MNVSAEAKKIVDALLNQPSATINTSELIHLFHSGSALMSAVNELSRQEIVDFVHPEVSMTDKGKTIFGHPSLEEELPVVPVPPSPSFISQMLVNWKKLLAGLSAILAFIWIVLSQVLAPQSYCPKLPIVVSDWLAPCANLGIGETK
ncbi:hypothetical protein MUY21_04695 [Aliiroseovarius sp. S2029]|uniref:hypothetical protein n=1 Tax=Aliiroseovarius sp. S2029 TaxID=2936988 RepID=UPI0020C17E1F|nr:hypothetical protein [Aliiroseovarius sp. S2029]MCK8483328.1 hypothetical protein [Aliiroseovarius sp. S2029]